MLSILFAVHDPGSTMALRPVLDSLKPFARLHVLHSPFALRRLNLEGTVHEPFTADFSAAEVFRKKMPDVLVTGTGWSPFEQALRNVAAAHGTKSITIVDFWVNYRTRWQGASYPIQHLPDIVCVIDEGMKSEMVGEGFPAVNLSVTGHPNLEVLSATAKELGGDPSRILFLSEPDSALHESVDRRRALVITAEALGKTQVTGKKLHLSFKPHPKETLPTGFAADIQKLSSPQIELKIMNAQTLLSEIAGDYGLIIGYQTMGLFEMAASGKRTVAIPTSKTTASLRRALQTFAIPSAELQSQSLQLAIERAYAQIPAPKQIYAGATQRVVDLIRGP